MKKFLALLLALVMIPACAMADEAECFTVLLMGADAEREVNSDTGYAPSDALIIASVNVNTGAIRILSLDTNYLAGDEWRLGDTTRDGTPDRTISCVNKLFSLDISHYIYIDTNGLSSLTGILGAVEMDITEADCELEFDGGGKLFGEAGRQMVSSEQMAAFVSARSGDTPEARARRQLRALTAIYASFMTGGVAAAIDMAGAALEFMETNITPLEITLVGAGVFNAGAGSVLVASSPMTAFDEVKLGGATLISPREADAESAQVASFLFK